MLLGLLIVLALARAAGYFVYAAACLPSAFETFALEAKMVLLAYRVEMGLGLYPNWRDYPHVADFFGPVYFGAVGRVGRATGAEIPELFLIGRVISFGSGLLTSLVAGVVAARRYGRWPGVAGAILSLGAAPMVGFSVMVRPDMAAEFLGVAGFFLAIGRTPARRALGGAVLVLAMLTKQTAAVYLVAASLAWAIDGDWRRGLRLGLGGAAALVLIVGAITLLVEPNFAGSLLGESKTPWDLGSLIGNVRRICLLAPDVLFFPLLGLALWASGATGSRDGRLAVLAALLLLSSVVLSAKRGADLNYYLGLRAVEALAVGAWWRAWSLATSRPRSATLAVMGLLGCLTIVPGVDFVAKQVRSEQGKARLLASPLGREFRQFYREVCAMAADPRSRLLTDSGLIDLYQGERAAFGDPWLFRMLTQTGRIDPALMRQRIDSQYYDLIITTSELDRPSYDTYDFGLPGTLVERARARYLRIDQRAGLFLYGRRPRAVPEPGPSPGASPRPDRP